MRKIDHSDHREKHIKSLEERLAIIKDPNHPRRDEVIAQTFKTLQEAGIYDENMNLTKKYRENSQDNLSR